jgi:hypothetical protein
MNPRINQLVRSLLKKDSLEQCSLPELQQFAERHPYFGAAQLLLTKKMQTDSPEKYDEQLQKTFLFFHNPLWVEHLLNDKGNASIIRARKEDLSDVAPATVFTPVEISANAEPLAANAVIAPVLSVEQEKELEVSPAMPEAIASDAPEKPGVMVIPDNTATLVEKQPPAGTPAPGMEPATGNAELVFEPYYTVDYFASQGIKLKEEEQPKDKFGQQLKSFTEWLKTMKRLPVAEIIKASEPVAEKKVEEMAEHSLEDREVLTEAMAEVWEKQGNTIKAIDIYSKLSLLEPSKSVYFAAKIEELKKLN